MPADMRPETVMVRGRDLKPYYYGLWCSIEGGEPFVNIVMNMGWRVDGKISIMLDTHNFMVVEPDEDVEMVPVTPSAWAQKKFADWSLGPDPFTFEARREEFIKLLTAATKKTRVVITGWENGEPVLGEPAWEYTDG